MAVPIQHLQAPGMFAGLQQLAQSNAMMAERARQEREKKQARQQALLTLAGAVGGGFLGNYAGIGAGTGAMAGAGIASLAGPQPNINAAVNFGVGALGQYQQGQTRDAEKAGLEILEQQYQNPVPQQPLVGDGLGAFAAPPVAVPGSAAPGGMGNLAPWLLQLAGTTAPGLMGVGGATPMQTRAQLLDVSRKSNTPAHTAATLLGLQREMQPPALDPKKLEVLANEEFLKLSLENQTAPATDLMKGLQDKGYPVSLIEQNNLKNHQSNRADLLSGPFGQVLQQGVIVANSELPLEKKIQFFETVTGNQEMMKYASEHHKDEWFRRYDSLNAMRDQNATGSDSVARSYDPLELQDQATRSLIREYGTKLDPQVFKSLEGQEGPLNMATVSGALNIPEGQFKDLVETRMLEHGDLAVKGTKMNSQAKEAYQVHRAEMIKSRTKDRSQDLPDVIVESMAKGGNLDLVHRWVKQQKYVDQGALLKAVNLEAGKQQQNMRTAKESVDQAASLLPSEARSQVYKQKNLEGQYEKARELLGEKAKIEGRAKSLAEEFKGKAWPSEVRDDLLKEMRKSKLFKEDELQGWARRALGMAAPGSSKPEVSPQAYLDYRGQNRAGYPLAAR